jgi:phosphoserine aminotransferase
MNNIKYFTPGPSELYPNIDLYIKEALENKLFSISHRSSWFQDIYQELDTNLKNLLKIPKNYSIFFVGSATECMERIIQNGVNKSSLHLVNGAFSNKFYNTAICQNMKSFKIETDPNICFDANILDKHNDSEVICLTHNETSNGTMINSNLIKSLKRKFKDKLFAIDVVSSIPYIDFDIHDFDYLFFSVQKGFGLPAGLGVMVLSPDAIMRAEILSDNNNYAGGFHSITNLQKYYMQWQTPETPNILVIFLLNQIVKDMLAKGIDNIKLELLKKANMLYRFFDSFDMTDITNHDVRSITTIVINSNNCSEIHKDLLKNNIKVGSGYKDNKDSQIRIGNYPATSIEDTLNLINIFKKNIEN